MHLKIGKRKQQNKKLLEETDFLTLAVFCSCSSPLEVILEGGSLLREQNSPIRLLRTYQAKSTTNGGMVVGDLEPLL